MNCKYLTIQGVTATIPAWAKVSGIHPNTIRSRLRNGYRPECAVFQPPLNLYSIYDNHTDLPLVTGKTARDCADYLGIKYKTFREEMCGRSRNTRTVVRDDWEFDPEEYRDAISKVRVNTSYE